MKLANRATTVERWWPSRYGADDQIGSLNEITPQAVVRAASLVRDGSVDDLSHVLDEHIPALPGRSFRQFLTTPAHQVNAWRPDAGGGGLGRNNVNWIVEQVSATSQMGTQVVPGINNPDRGDC